MVQPPSDEAWLDALTGSSSGADTASRQAAQLRNYYTQRSTLELQDTLDDASHLRSMNALRARGAFQPPEPAAPPPAPTTTWRSIARDWLFPFTMASGSRYALVAAVIVAALAVPRIVMEPEMQAPSWHNDNLSAAPTSQAAPAAPAFAESVAAAPPAMQAAPAPSAAPSPIAEAKSVAPAAKMRSHTRDNAGANASLSDTARASSDKAAPPAARAPAANEPAVLLSSNPMQLAQEIASVLRARGVQAKIRSADGQTHVAADMNADQRAAVQPAVQVYGIDIPPSGQLRLTLRPR